MAHNWPISLTSFVGREAELGLLEERLGRERLVTLTGPGGSGKTRLAVEVARRVAARFDDGAWMIELAPLDKPDQVAAAVAAVLGVREEPDRPLKDTLVDAVAGRHLLLVLDNCEHLVETVAALCER